MKIRSLACRALVLSALMFVTSVHAAEEQPLSQETDLAVVRQRLKMQPQETAIFVGDMHCAHCAKKVSRKLYGVKGVVKVRTDLKIDVAIVTPQKEQQLDPQALWKAAEASTILPIKLIGPEGVLEASDEERAEAAQSHDHAAETP